MLKTTPPPSLPWTTQSLGIMPPVVYKRICNHLYLFPLFCFCFVLFFEGVRCFGPFGFMQVHLARPSLRTGIDTIAFFRLDTFEGFWTMAVYPFIYKHVFVHTYFYCQF